jgi:hypothetical protein
MVAGLGNFMKRWHLQDGIDDSQNATTVASAIAGVSTPPVIGANVWIKEAFEALMIWMQRRQGGEIRYISFTNLASYH